jgi:nitrate reductase assembly molybdenum cofactor insertion protein NarJ
MEQDESLKAFDDLWDRLVDAVEHKELSDVRAIMLEQLALAEQPNPNRGLIRTTLICLKPIKHLPELADVFKKLADILRAGSTHGVI